MNYFFRLNENIANRDIGHLGIHRLALKNFKQRYLIQEEFVVAAYLDPRQATAPYIREFANKKGFEFVYEIVKAMAEKYGIINENEEEQEEDAAAQTQNASAMSNGNGDEGVEEDSRSRRSSINPMKRIRLEQDELLAELITMQNIPANEIDNSIHGEIERYNTTCEMIKGQKQLDVIHFWKTHKQEFPILFELVKVIFAISPTSADVERHFSIAGDLLRAKRASLNPSRAEKILLVHANIKALKAQFEEE